MTVATIDIEIQPSDGWTLVATNPSSLMIRPSTPQPWRLAVTAAGVPAANLRGLVFGNNKDRPFETVETGPITGLVYIRVDEPLPNKQHFGVVRDQ